MSKITIAGVAPFDGDYELDVLSPFSNSEWHLIKRLTDIRMGEYMEAVRAGDNDIIVAWGTIAIVRAGLVEKSQGLRTGEMLMDAEFGSIKVDHTNPEADEAPPAQPPIGGNKPDSPSEPDETSTTSSPTSSDDSEPHPENGLSSTGALPLDTFAESESVTLES